MKRFILEEQEKGLIKKLYEQTTPTSGTQVDQNLQKLLDAIKNRCIKGGKLYLNKTKNQYYYRVIKRKTGQEIDIFPDMTYKFVDGSKSGKLKKCKSVVETPKQPSQNDQITTNQIESLKKQKWRTVDELLKSGVDFNVIDRTHDKVVIGNVTLYKLKNPEESNITDVTKLSDQEQRFLKNYTDQGFRVNVPIEDQAPQGRFLQYIPKNIPSGLFINGLVLWYDPNTIRTSQTKEDVKDFKQELKSQTPQRNVCRRAVTTLYNSYRQRKSGGQGDAKITDLRNTVVACKGAYYPSGWGPGLPTGKKLNQMLAVLSGEGSDDPAYYNSPYYVE